MILEGRKHYIVAVIVLVVSTVSLIYGSRYLFKRTSPSLAKSIQYQYALQNSSGHALKAVRFYAFVPIKQTSFQRCQNIQASHPYEIQTAQNLKAHKPIKTVENIFNWVAAHITYAGYTKNAHGALYAHLYQKRDCTEYMHLFIALCRANQIPARGIAGYVVTTNRKVKPSEYHNWAEFFDGKRWQIADPQKKIFMQDEQNYIAMRILHTTPTAPIEPFKRFKVDPKGVKVKMI